MIDRPLSLPCGVTLPNRLCKSAMTEGLASPTGRATPEHQRVYAKWAAGGAALHVSGNIMIDRRYLERAGNVVVEDDAGLAELRAWTATVHAQGSVLWGQVSHPGRQCPRLVNLHPLAPSPVQLDLVGNFGRPRAMTEEQIRDVIARFGRTAGVLKAAGFDGVQVHSAHGYLLSQFLSPRTNRRTDGWGGSLENRARLLLESVRAVRTAVGTSFPLGVKLNSSDFVKGGFEPEECVQVVRWLSDAGIDLLEVSGGTYEQIEFFKAHAEDEIRDSTRHREAMFLKYADAIKAVATMPVMVTGGFRTRAGMDDALARGATDMIGLARPFCLDAAFPRRLLAGELPALPVPEDRLVLGRGFWGPNSSSKHMQGLNNQCQAGWYYHQIERMGAGREPDPMLSPWGALLGHLSRDFVRSMARKFA